MSVAWHLAKLIKKCGLKTPERSAICCRHSNCCMSLKLYASIVNRPILHAKQARKPGQPQKVNSWPFTFRDQIVQKLQVISSDRRRNYHSALSFNIIMYHANTCIKYKNQYTKDRSVFAREESLLFFLFSPETNFQLA